MAVNTRTALPLFSLALLGFLSSALSESTVASSSAAVEEGEEFSLLQAAVEAKIQEKHLDACPATDTSCGQKTSMQDAAAEPAGAQESSIITHSIRYALEFIACLILARKVKDWRGEGGLKKSSKAASQSSVAAAPASPTGSLMQAAQAGDYAQVKALLQGGARANTEDAWGCSALHAAAAGDHAQVVKLLLSAGADAEAIDAVDETPLHLAARNGAIEACKVLLSRNVDANAVNMEGLTPLVVAAKAKQEGMCEFLLRSGAHCGGLADEELPSMLTLLLAKRMVAGGEE